MSACSTITVNTTNARRLPLRDLDDQIRQNEAFILINQCSQAFARDFGTSNIKLPMIVCHCLAAGATFCGVILVHKSSRS